MSEETVDTILTQMLKFILEQAPMFMLVIIALLIVLGVIYTLVKLGLVSTKSASEAAPQVCPHTPMDEEYRKAMLARLTSMEQAVKDLNENVTHAREIIIAVLQAR